MGRRRRRYNRRPSIENPEQWFTVWCRCGRILWFRFRRLGPGGDEIWDLHVWDPESKIRMTVDDRACPKCHQSFAECSAGELKDLFWPGGRAG